MRIAVPMADGFLAQHFGQCEKFALIDVDLERKEITDCSEFAAPEHQPGLLPTWLKERGVALVIAGGMGSRAHSLFREASIEVLAGARPGAPAPLCWSTWAARSTGANACDH